MPIPANFAYPKNATNAVWQKAKSFKDKTKAKTKTGLGATLTKAEAGWKPLRWKALNAHLMAPKSLQEAEANLNAAKQQILLVHEAHRLTVEASKEALEVSNNPALSSKAQATAKQISSDLALAAKQLFAIEINDFEAAVKRLKQ